MICLHTHCAVSAVIAEASAAAAAADLSFEGKYCDTFWVVCLNFVTSSYSSFLSQEAFQLKCQCEGKQFSL